MMSAATSPLAAMSAPALDSAMVSQQSVTGSEFAGGAVTPDRGAPAGAGASTVERAQDAARTASWWTVIGMLIGAGVTMGGAWMCAPKATAIVGD